MVYKPTKNKYAVEYKTAKKFNSRLAAENAAKKLEYGVKYYVIKL